MNWIDEANKKLEKQRADYQESIDSGEAAARNRSANASNAAKSVSKKNRIKNGKTTGNIHIKSGHIFTLNDEKYRTPGQRAEAGKLAGAKNVETGWIKEFQKIGTDKATKKLLDKKLAEIKTLHTIMEADKSYRLFELVKIVTHVKDRRLGRLLYDELAKPYILIKKDGQKTFFSKI